MARLAPPGFQPSSTGFTRSIEYFAGAEANVAASLSFMGEKAKFVTALPDNDLARACARRLEIHWC